MNMDTYSSGKAQSWRDKAELSARMKIYNFLNAMIPIEDCSSIIDIGVTADDKKDSSNFFEKMYPYPNRITALSDQNASWMAEKWNGLKFVRGNALSIPFEDGAFELSFSNAVIEHTGSRNNQITFIRECIRVSSRYVFITTPNRYYPIELHVALPLIHWLPAPIFRRILKLINKPFFASEDNLNLLSKKDLVAIMKNFHDVEYTINTIRFLGFPSNLLLIVKK
ncbi:MAG: class I SAM-dependent methyltransferase [Defluviitaleaceae bacterium]|nr:class I SAM-dependent methyltransferase [Defluviitaleaceae bacterium]